MSLTDAFLLDPAPFNIWIAYRGDGAGSGTANASHAPRYAVQWMTNRLAVENNIFELYRYDADSESSSRGVSTYAGVALPSDDPQKVVQKPYCFTRLLFRENLMRHVDNAPEDVSGLGGHSLGMRIISMGGAIVDGNIVDYPNLAFPNPPVLHDWASEDIVSFNNQSPSGSVRHVFQDSSANGSGAWVQRDDLETRLQAAFDEATVLSFL